MANWLYNGVELPELPEWDKTAYPYACITYTVVASGRYALYLGAGPYYRKDTDGTYDVGVLLQKRYYLTSNGTWSESSASGDYHWIGDINKEWDGKYPLWTTADIIREDGSVYLAASNPIRLDSKLSISVGQMMDYNGVVLPPLPEWDKETYPYAAMDTSFGGWLYCSNKPYIVGGDSGVYTDGTHKYKVWEFENGVWVLDDEGEGDFNAVTLDKDDLFWSNHDILNEDGTVFMAASDPVPTGDYNCATFTCSNLNTTDNVYKIAAWCYPKGTSYLDAPFTYVSAANFAGADHSESWGLTGLTAGTEYELYACIMVDDVATDHNALVTFTTDGMAELDFSNATLTVAKSAVDFTDFQFELEYTGLPYNADGTSAVFHIVGVTDKGDEALMGWRATSGDGIVDGVFFDLEPLTDYTATFEVYYNGQPTGVTASVSFTTGEGDAVGGYDRDSFLLGFASGLGATAATKDGAEYNSWAWGYIAGSALRKAL